MTDAFTFADIECAVDRLRDAEIPKCDGKYVGGVVLAMVQYARALPFGHEYRIAAIKAAHELIDARSDVENPAALHRWVDECTTPARAGRGAGG